MCRKERTEGNEKATKLLSIFLVAAILMGALPAMTAFAVKPYLPVWEYIPDGELYPQAGFVGRLDLGSLLGLMRAIGQ